jgi:polysaccharide export outer membrane protein
MQHNLKLIFSRSKFASPVGLLVVGLLIAVPYVYSQNSAANKNNGDPEGLPSSSSTTTLSESQKRDLPPAGRSGFMISPGDELEVTVYGAPDLSPKARVSSDGNISLPLVGYLHLAGLSSDQAEQVIEDELRRRNIIKDPQVSVFVREYTNAGISVAGEVSKPGVYPALGPHRLFDILQAAGGPTEDVHARSLKAAEGLLRANGVQE